MTTFLLLVSFILNAAAIFAIILLYLRQNRLVEAEKKQERMIAEIEEVFSSYLLELKDENDKFLTSINHLNHDPRPEKPLAGSEVNPDGFVEELPLRATPRIGKGAALQAARKAYQQNKSEDRAVPSLPSEPEAPVMPLSFPDKVEQLISQGRSIEEIARELNKGKTEIELLLKFRQNTKQ